MDAAPLPRREFGRLLTAGIGGVALGMSGETHLATAQEPPVAEKPKPPSMAALIHAQIVADCPSEHWDDATLESLMGDIRGDLARGRTLKTVPLTNADEPGPIFAAYRTPEPRPQ
ncbi:MAG: hypothetical protein SH850_28405 [Planctomycetaceae bacterium]|nr:hypothetical protein [Planctomycetaceae bacterium]